MSRNQKHQIHSSRWGRYHIDTKIEALSSTSSIVPATSISVSMPPKRKENKLKSIENETLEDFSSRVDNVDYIVGRNDLTKTSFFKFISEVH